MQGRQAFLSIEIDNSDISKEVAKFTLSFTYTDKASGESDSIDFTLSDKDALFIDSWYPMQNTIADNAYGEMTKALQKGVNVGELQSLINASNLTKEQGDELMRLTVSADWDSYAMENPQYKGEEGKLTLINDIKGERPGVKAGARFWITGFIQARTQTPHTGGRKMRKCKRSPSGFLSLHSGKQQQASLMCFT